jgi:hypothetical protein
MLARGRAGLSIGAEVNLDVARRYPPTAKEIRTPLHEDGSVADA